MAKQSVFVMVEGLETRALMSASSVLDSAPASVLNDNAQKGLLNAFEHNSDQAKQNSGVFGEIASLIPVVSGVGILPDSMASVSVLSAFPVATVGNGASISFSYQWLINGTPVDTSLVPSAATQFLQLNQFVSSFYYPPLQHGDQIAVIVTPTANGITGSPVTSNPVTLATAYPDPFTLAP